jgi:ribbon-helix-helix CopG family protein
MRRVHLQLTDDQAAAIESNAAATGRPLTVVIREAVEFWRSSQDRTRRIERALAATGGFRSGLHDVAERHDDYLAMDLEEEMRERWR